MNFKSFITVNIGAIIMLAFGYQLTVYPKSFGGSSVLILFISYIIIITIIIKRNYFELSLMQLLVAGILGFNYLSYLELHVIAVESNQRYLTYFAINYVLFIAFFVILIRAPFKGLPLLDDKEQKIFMKFVFPLYSPIIAFGLAVNILSSILVLFIFKYGTNTLVNYPLLKLSYIATAWIIVSFVVTLLYIPRFNEYYPELPYRESKLNLMNYDQSTIRKVMIRWLIAIIVIGSIFEFGRGAWIMWVETVILIMLMMSLILKVYNPILINNIIEN
jgi:hypothetical protein